MQGWAGGKWHTKDFERALAAAGYSITGPLHADILVAHSTACYDLPLKTPIIYYFLIDPPYWPGKSIFQRVFAKKMSDSRFVRQKLGWKHLVIKTVWEVIYVLAKPGYTKLALKNNKELTFMSSLADKKVTLIRNEQDNFCSPDIQVALASYPSVNYVTVPGLHDDYYYNPQPYIDLLPKEL